MLVSFSSRGAQSAAASATSSNSFDSYNEDDARHYLHERHEALGRCWEVAQETEHLEAALIASQTALATVEGESGAARARLAESDARVAGKIFRRDPVLLVFCLVMPFSMIPPFFLTALMEELEAFQFVMNNDARALNAQGDLVVSSLQDIPIRA